MTYEEICDGIKSLKIQGAENIAKHAVKAFALKLQETRDENELRAAYEELKSLRATEPALRNALRYCLQNYKQNPNVADFVINHFRESKRKIAEIGAQKIQDGITVFTHCHSGTVTGILLEAKRQGKKFSVANTETRPRWQGRITAEELAEAGISVTHMVDGAGRMGLREADIFLFGCDSLTTEGNIVNKIGTAMFCEFANQYDIPAYCCTNSWKFNSETTMGATEKIEERAAEEVWESAPKGVRVWNPAFEVTFADNVNGIITELGIYKPETLIAEIQRNYPWL